MENPKSDISPFVAKLWLLPIKSKNEGFFGSGGVSANIRHTSGSFLLALVRLSSKLRSLILAAASSRSEGLSVLSLGVVPKY